MKATEARLLDFLKKSTQFIIPIYQRTYSWTEKQCKQLWDDIIQAGTNDAISVHFIGSIVYVEQGLSQVSHQAPLLVIDGQQRLTTVSLIIEALARALGDTEPVDGLSAAKLRYYYLSNNLESGDRFFKLLLTQTDDASMRAIIKKVEQPRERSILITENFAFFEGLVGELKGDLVPLYRGLEKLVVVDIALSRDQDNPQLIFESMNSTGKELSQADLIRNFILMGLEPKLQTRLYEEHWRPMELDFGQEAYSTEFDAFMRNYLTVKTGEIPRESEVYEAFKDFSRTADVLSAGIEALVKDIRSFSKYFCAMALGTEREPELKLAFHDLRELKVDVAYPFLLELYRDYDGGALSRDDFLSAVRMIESYVFRRSVCAIPTNSMNKTFATFGKALKKDRYLESIEAHFLLLPSYRRFPSDDEFRREFKSRDLYNYRSRSYWLRRLENHGRKERVAVEQYSIEHILPQNPSPSAEWKRDLGPEWQQVQKRWLHTLGNLTLTGCNSEMSDSSFAEKRDMEKGYKQSPLKLNEGLGSMETWNEAAIHARAEKLAQRALDIWKAPSLGEAVLAAYVPKGKTSGGYSIENHRYLLTPAIRELFEPFRKEVLAIDPCVSEEFLKLYVAYKAETNFVDVVPQSQRLRLSLNIPFPEINDPMRLCVDVTGKGRWGNGDVEVYYERLADLPDIMGLVRQCYERQMGEGDGR
jgi:uncharacterized protein with ParB-like and HNH nuclease domain/predicted transport protein